MKKIVTSETPLDFMKKVSLFILLVLIMISLSACTPRPLVGPAGTTLVRSNKITHSYYNNDKSQMIFSFEFTQELIFFEGPLYSSYDFTQVNNYLDISAEFIIFLDSFDYIYYDKLETEKEYEYLDLSIGASENNYNLVEVPVDDKVYDVDAFITDPSGMRIIFSYTEFYSNDELIIVPYHITFITHELFQEESITYLGPNNEYSEDGVKVITYTGLLIPLPMVVTEIHNSYPNKVDTDEYYDKVTTEESDIVNVTEYACETDDDINCFERVYGSKRFIVYYATEEEIISFYVDMFNGRYINDDFVVTNQGIDFAITFPDMDPIENRININVCIYK